MSQINLNNDTALGLITQNQKKLNDKINTVAGDPGIGAHNTHNS